MSGRARTVVAALALAVISVGCTTAFAESAADHPPHVAPPAAEASGPVSLAVVGGDVPQQTIDREAWIEGVARGEWFAGVELAEREAAAAREAAARAVPRSPGGGGGSCAGDVACFLECTIDHESRTSGVYDAVSPGGTYRGAYQFDQPTWDGAVSRAGFPEWVGRPPNEAPAYVQDAAAAQLYAERGNQPWGGRC